MSYNINNQSINSAINEDDDVFSKLKKRLHLIHMKDQELLQKKAELNKLLAEINHIRRFTEVTDHRNESISNLNFENNLTRTEYEKKILLKESQQLEMKYDLEIKLPSEYEASMIEKISKAKCDRISEQAEIDSWRIKKIGYAKIEYNYGYLFAEAEGMRKKAIALQEYYAAFILDRVAGYLLKWIADSYELDETYRFKLTKPLTYIGHASILLSSLYRKKERRKHTSVNERIKLKLKM